MNAETIKKASEVFFALLKEKILPDDHDCFKLFYEENVRDAVFILADQSNTWIIEAPKRIQLVSKASGSVFATNFSHLKEKYKEVENKKFFHIVSIIMMTFLYMIHKNEATKIQTKRDGVTYFALERHVNELNARWENLLKENPEYGLEKMIDMKQFVEVWSNMELDAEDGQGAKRGNKRTRIGLIITAMKVLEQEQLVIILDKDTMPKVYPKNELFERIEFLYQDYERFQEIKELIDMEDEKDA